jgi:hypothetical protein
VLSDGVLAEEGSHGELMARKGLYFQLVTAQTVEEEEETSSSSSASEAEEDEGLKNAHLSPTFFSLSAV